MALSFGDMLSNALHAIKQHTGKKISILQDEIGYAFDPALTGDTIESWRYRKRPPTTVHFERLAATLIAYRTPTHDRAWLTTFLQSADHPYPDAICDKLFSGTVQPAIVTAPPLSGAPVDFAPPPLTSYRPPAAAGFVGRATELDTYNGQLATTSIAVIAGMAGVGKTSLATVIANQVTPPDTVFWHSFYDADLTPLLRRLAGFLAGHGRAELWEAYESARVAGARPPDVTSSLDTLLAHLAGLDLLLCLDDLQFVDDDPRVQEFLQRITTAAKIPAKLLITSRRAPAFLAIAHDAELHGLTLADTQLLLEKRAIDLAPPLTQQLYEVTTGHGAFLTLAAVVLCQTRDAAALIDQLARVDNIERFLMQEVNDRLSSNEQRVMEAVAVLCGYPGTRDVLEVMLNQRDVRRTLRDLRDQYLITVQQTADELTYSQHQILQAFYYDQPPRATRRTYHQRAGEYYEQEAFAPYQAVLHYTKGNLSVQAVALGNEHLWHIVNQGQGRTFYALAEALTNAQLDEAQRLDVLLLRGQLGTFLGEYDDARAHLETANQLVGALPVNDETNTVCARICLAMAKLLERSTPPDALAWAEQGLESAPYEDKPLLAALKIQAGTISLYMGNLGGAMETLHDQC